jgi:hypothetical protein
MWILRPFEGGFDPKKRSNLKGSWDSSSKPQNLYKPGFSKLVGDFLMWGFEGAVCEFWPFSHVLRGVFLMLLRGF